MERGEANPTLKALDKVAGGLGCGATRLFCEEAAHDARRNRKEPQ
jgi:transcriptional regulator with XRE-family HTH domain